MKRYRKLYSQREAAALDRELQRLKSGLRDGFTCNSVAVEKIQLNDPQLAAVRTARACGHVIILSPGELRVAKLPEVGL